MRKELYYSGITSYDGGLSKSKIDEFKLKTINKLIDEGFITFKEIEFVNGSNRYELILHESNLITK